MKFVKVCCDIKSEIETLSAKAPIHAGRKVACTDKRGATHCVLLVNVFRFFNKKFVRVGVIKYGLVFAVSDKARLKSLPSYRDY